MFNISKKKPKVTIPSEEDFFNHELSKHMEPQYKEPVQSIAKAIIERPKTFKIYTSTCDDTTSITVVDTVTKLTHSYSKRFNKETGRVEYSYSKDNLLRILTGHEILFLKRVLLQTREERLKAVKERKRQRITKLYQ